MAFQQLELDVQNHIILNAPRGNQPLVITTDASNSGVGCILMQLQDEELVIIECGSSKFSETQLRWSAREKEDFAVKFAVEKFEDNLYNGCTQLLPERFKDGPYSCHSSISKYGT
eukprot:Filipodium_phascolosomae@DN73_c0_g1_i1.p1